MLKIKRCIVTVTDEVSATSMPFNEFLLHRFRNYPDEKQVLMVLFDKTLSPTVTLPEGLEAHLLGANVFEIARVADNIVKDCALLGCDTVFHIHEAKSVALFNLATKFRYVSKIVYTVHSTFKNYRLRTKFLSARASRRSAYTVCVGKTSFKYFPNHLKNKCDVVAIPNGIDFSAVEKTVALLPSRLPDEPFTLIYVARFVPTKRQAFLLSVVAAIPEVRLKLVGDGAEKGKLVALCNKLGIADRVEFCGLCAREEVYRLVSQADAYVSASSHEGLPLSVLEAMSCGKPCLLSDIEQHREIAQNASSLILIHNSVKSWKEEIKRLIFMGEKEREEVGEKNREAAKKFSVSEMHEKYSELYEKICKASPKTE